MPLDLGAKGSCMIGGNLATNAGGIKFIRHNSLHANAIGLKAVLADGTILDNMTTVRKDNTGYDLKHLFIGSEGTLGVITECSLLCPPLPKNRNLAMVGCRKFTDVLELLRIAKSELGDTLQAFECMDRASMDVVLREFKTSSNPFGQTFPFYALFETGSLNEPNHEATADTKKGDDEMNRMFKVFEKAQDFIIVSTNELTELGRRDPPRCEASQTDLVP